MNSSPNLITMISWRVKVCPLKISSLLHCAVARGGSREVLNLRLMDRHGATRCRPTRFHQKHLLHRNCNSKYLYKVSEIRRKSKRHHKKRKQAKHMYYRKLLPLRKVSVTNSRWHLNIRHRKNFVWKSPNRSIKTNKGSSNLFPMGNKRQPTEE